jgi:hypothetical protein
MIDYAWDLEHAALPPSAVQLLKWFLNGNVGRDSRGRVVSPRRYVRTPALVTTIFTAGFLSGYMISVTTKAATDVVLDQVDRLFP